MKLLIAVEIDPFTAAHGALRQNVAMSLARFAIDIATGKSVNFTDGSSGFTGYGASITYRVEEERVRGPIVPAPQT